MADQDDHLPKAADHQTVLVAHMMTPGVVQIPGDVSVTEAASLLERERMPCLLVKDTDPIRPHDADRHRQEGRRAGSRTRRHRSPDHHDTTGSIYRIR